MNSINLWEKYGLPNPGSNPKREITKIPLSTDGLTWESYRSCDVFGNYLDMERTSVEVAGKLRRLTRCRENGKMVYNLQTSQSDFPKETVVVVDGVIANSYYI